MGQTTKTPDRSPVKQTKALGFYVSELVTTDSRPGKRGFIPRFEGQLDQLEEPPRSQQVFVFSTLDIVPYQVQR